MKDREGCLVKVNFGHFRIFHVVLDGNCSALMCEELKAPTDKVAARLVVIVSTGHH
jgi:hypothetical protein